MWYRVSNFWHTFDLINNVISGNRPKNVVKSKLKWKFTKFICESLYYLDYDGVRGIGCKTRHAVEICSSICVASIVIDPSWKTA